MITVTAYDNDRSFCQTIKSVDELEPIFKEWRTVWVQVHESENPEIIKKIGETLNIHQLALEDVLSSHQRPKVEQYGDVFFLIVHELFLEKEDVSGKQLCFFLANNYVVSFQTEPMQSLKSVTERISSNQGDIRSQGADYLSYAILDSVVDTYFPVLENLGEELEDLEDVILESPSREAIVKIHEVKRSLLSVRRLIWPTRELINSLLRDSAHRFSEEFRFSLRDCYDHAVEIIELNETYRELAADLMDVYLSSISNRLNEIMRVLTIIAVIFAPPTFIASIYGMNFNTSASPYNMPELNWRYGYPAALLAMFIASTGMVVLLWWKGWLDGGVSNRSGKS